MRKFLVITIVLAMSTSAFGQMNSVLKYGSHNVNGVLDDWAGAEWESFDTIWTQGGSQANNDFGGGEFSATWTTNGIYVAARITDNDHQFSASGYGTWNGNDFLEIYIDPCDENFGDITTDGLTNGAQFTMGRDATGDWTSVGNTNIPWSSFAGSLAVASGVTAISGADLIYEAYIPWAFDGGNVTLGFGKQIGFEVATFTKFGTAYQEWQGRHAGTGALFGPFNSQGWTSYTLIPEPFTMSLLGIGGLALLRRRKK